MLSDWYSFSHVVHGLLFYAALWLLMRRWSVQMRFLVALLIESAWEVIENTPFVIDRYRETTAALGYTGDSVINSLSDILMMVVGFLAARRLPVWASVALVGSLMLSPLLLAEAFRRYPRWWISVMLRVRTSVLAGQTAQHRLERTPPARKLCATSAVTAAMRKPLTKSIQRSE